MKAPASFALLSLLTVGCTAEDGGDDSDSGIDTGEEAIELLNVGTQTDNGRVIEFLATEDLKVGWNQVYFRITDEDTGERITDASIAMAPLMTMESSAHACAFTNPEGPAGADGLFAAEMVFPMASGMMGTWSNAVDVHDTAAGSDHAVVFDMFDVAETDMKKNLTFGTDPEHIYIVTLTMVDEPIVGENDFILTVHEKETMMSFPPVEDLTITVDPQMPDMGHGSYNNVDPTYDANGRYHGVANFTMTGTWTVDFVFTQDATEIGTIQYAFDL